MKIIRIRGNLPSIHQFSLKKTSGEYPVNMTVQIWYRINTILYGFILAVPGKSRVGVNSIPDLELQLNSNSGIGIGIETGRIENEIGIENPGIGIGIETWNWFFLQLLPQQLIVNQPFPNFSFNRGSQIFHVTDSSCNICSWDFAPLWCGHKRHMGRVPCSPE